MCVYKSTMSIEVIDCVYIYGLFGLRGKEGESREVE